MTFSQPAFSVSKVVAQGGPEGGVDRTFHTQVTLNGPWAMKLFAMLEPDAFLCLTVLLMCSETAENGGLMVRGGASRVAREIQWGRPKTSKVLNRLHAAGLIRKEQTLKSTPNGPRFVDAVIWITEGDEIRSLYSNPVDRNRDNRNRSVDQPGSSTELTNASEHAGAGVTFPDGGKSHTNIMSMLMNDIHQHDVESANASAESQTYRTLLSCLQQYGFADAESFLVEHPTEVIAAAIAHVQRAPAGSVRNPGGLIRNMVKTGAVPQIVYGIRDVAVTANSNSASGDAASVSGAHPYEDSPDSIGCAVCGMPESNRRHRVVAASQPGQSTPSGEQVLPVPGPRAQPAVLDGGDRTCIRVPAERTTTPVPARTLGPALDGDVIRPSSHAVVPLREIAEPPDDPMQRLRRLLVERGGNLLADEAG